MAECFQSEGMKFLKTAQFANSFKSLLAIKMRNKFLGDVQRPGKYSINITSALVNQRAASYVSEQ